MRSYSTASLSTARTWPEQESAATSTCAGSPHGVSSSSSQSSCNSSPVNVFGPRVPDRAHAWEVFRHGLGLTGPVALGDKVRLTPEGLPAMAGVVDWVSPSFLGVRTEDGLYRFMHTFDASVGVGHHIFVEGLDQEDTEQAWASWLTKLFT